ncbi:hypothetical protein SteCoe_16893 [Stentor coeruleus]|uniref:Uncharacterized protein n=1 Tax=Stentor coeruleus TaxID=5963 RepID=A0A1R2C0B4_9CILI|nr:hypothetical protein SteCoe_16893 [Stentor coeruleus]
MEPSQSQKNIRPLSARKINTLKTGPKKKPLKISDSNKMLKRISPKIITPSLHESSTLKNPLSTRTLSSEFTLTPREINKALIKLEREHSDLLGLYSKLSDDLLHLKTLEKVERQKDKQIAQAKAKLQANIKEKSQLQNSLRICESIFKEFSKKMEKGLLGDDERRMLALQIEGFLKNGERIENDEDSVYLKELWELLPKAERVLSRITGK